MRQFFLVDSWLVVAMTAEQEALVQELAGAVESLLLRQTGHRSGTVIWGRQGSPLWSILLFKNCFPVYLLQSYVHIVIVG
jgi:hypothetical protein